VRRLAGSDAGFLFIESPTMTSICVDLAELSAPPPGADPLTRESLRDHIAARLPLLASWRWRLEEVPLGLAHPVWIEDPDLDLDHHVRAVDLPSPGGEAELEALMASVLPDHLDLRHPPWRVTLVDGLAGGRQALLFQFHHVLADGAALITTLDRLFGPPPDGPAPAWRPERVRRSRVLLDALRSQVMAWLRLPLLLVETLRRFKAVEDHRRTAPAEVPRSMGDAPACTLNESSTADRAYARLSLPLADLRAVKDAAGTTLSDVVLAVVAAGLRSYLAARDEHPDGPLVANVPVGDDPVGAEPRQWGNRFANFFTTLATDVDDPCERLAAIHVGAEEAKVQLDLLGRATLPAWLDRIPPVVARPAARAMARRHTRPDVAPDFNVLVSNVRIDASAWAVGPQRVEAMFMSGPIADGAGLNVTLVGDGDRVRVSLVANPSAVDDVHELADALRAGLAELVAAHAARATPADPAAPSTTTSPSSPTDPAPTATATGA
jgi:diacylglycerol O-acyltransferase